MTIFKNSFCSFYTDVNGYYLSLIFSAMPVAIFEYCSFIR